MYNWSFNLSKRTHRGLRHWVLYLLQEGPKNGVELMDSMESMSHGWWRPSPGSIYPILESMAKEGVVERNGDGKYELTKAGKEEMDGSSRFRDQPPRTVEDVLEQMSGYVSYLEDIVQSEGDKMKKNAATLRQLSDRIRRLGGEGE